MLANGRSRPTLFPNNSSNSSNAESSNSSFHFAQTSEGFAPIPDPHKNGLDQQLTSDDRNILDEIDEFTEGSNRQTNSTINNNNKSNFWPNKMAATNASGPSQQLSNTNGFPLSMASSSGMPNKTGTPSLNISPSVHNNEVTNMLDQATGNISNPTSASMNMISGGASSSSLSSSTQYNLFNSRQELLLHGFQAGSRSSNAGHEISNPTMRGAPNASEQYGSPQQRSYISASNESQIRGLNRQTPSPFSSNYFPQESHNTQSGSRVVSSQSEERTLNSGEHYQWQQPPHRYQTSHSSNPSPGQSLSRSPMQQPSMPPRQPPPYMMSQQPSQQQQYMMQSQMKPNSMLPQVQQYYGGMGMSGMVGHGSMQRPQGMASTPMPKPQPDYSSYQQQHYQHYSQQPHGQYPSQMPPYMQSRQQQQQQHQQQQSLSQTTSNLSRMMSSHQPILPKPSSDMYGPAMTSSRYPNNMSAADSSMEFPGQAMNEHVQQQSQQRTQQSYPSTAGMAPSDTPGRPVLQRGGYYPGYPSSPSPNITMGSPLRNLPEGYPPSTPNAGPLSGPLPGTSSFPNTPPPSSGMPLFSSNTSMSSHGGAAAAAAAAVMAAASSFPPRYPGVGQSSVDHSSHGFGGSHEGMSNSRGQMGVVPSPRSGTPSLPPSGLPTMEGSAGGNGVETGLVPSPTLNMLPTAEDVEAMIQSMRSEDLSEDTPSSPNCTPTIPVSSCITTAVTSQSSQQPIYTNSSEVNNTSESQGTAASSPSQNVTPHPMTNNTSPLSSFSEEFPAVPSPEVSISSSFGDDDDGMNVPVDDITPTLGQSPGSAAQKQLSKPSLQHSKYSQIYEISNDPERKEFLDKYAAFMESTGNPVKQVPLIDNKPLDIFKLYKVIKQYGGLQEVVKRKLWDKVMSVLDISQVQQTSWSSHIRNHYTRYLLAYEMTEVATHNSMDNLLEDTGLPPPNATVTCSEAIFPSVTVSSTQSSSNSSTYPTGYSSMTNGPQGYNNYNYRQNDGYSDTAYDNSKFYPSGMDSRPPVAQPNNSFNVQPYSYNNERTSYPNYNRPYPSHPASSMQYPGSAALTQLLQQRSQQSSMQGYGQHPLTQRRPMGGQPQMNLSQQDQVNAMWGSQYNAAAEPEHMFDYPPNGPPTQSMRPSMSQNQYPQTPGGFNSFSSRSPAPYPQTPQQYTPAGPQAHGSSSPSLPRQPMTPTQQHQQQSQHSLQKPKFQLHHTKREIYFPPDAVESTKPVFTKKRKLTSRDLGPVEAWRVMMSLKSGLLSETTWALDTLNILLYDDHTVGYFLLSHLPGLLDNLLDHFRRYLFEIFGSFWENDVHSHTAGPVKTGSGREECGKSKKNDETDEKLEKDVCRSLTAFIAASAIDDDNDDETACDDSICGRTSTFIHIQTHLGTAVSPKRPKRFTLASDEKEELSLTKQGDETCCKLKHSESDTSVADEFEEAVTCHIKQEHLDSTKECAVKCCTEKEEIKTENCFTNSQTNEWDFDSDSDSSSDFDEVSTKGLSAKTEKNDQCLSSVEDFTAKLKKELDLDIDSLQEESETNSYVKSIIETKVERSKNSTVIEEESIRQEDAALSLRTESDDAISRRCVCVSNILRGLSFVPGNDVEMFKHSGLLLILGKLLLLCHKHAKRVSYRHSYMHDDDVEMDTPIDDRDDWWWHSLDVLRENALVIFSNIAGQLDLTVYSKTISTPILDGLLHWFVCRSAEAIDPMPTATFGTSLSAQQLVLEALAKMSILGGNAELILSMPTPYLLEALYATLVRLLGQRDNPVTRELTLVVLSNLSQSDNGFACLVEKKQCIAMLLQFIEDAANSINAYSTGGSLAQAGFHSEDFCGTSVDMLRRAASSLVCLARCKPIRSLFLPYQERLLMLTTLKLLERMIGSQLAEVLYYLSR